MSLVASIFCLSAFSDTFGKGPCIGRNQSDFVLIVEGFTRDRPFRSDTDSDDGSRLFLWILWSKFFAVVCVRTVYCVLVLLVQYGTYRYATVLVQYRTGTSIYSVSGTPVRTGINIST